MEEGEDSRAGLIGIIQGHFGTVVDRMCIPKNVATEEVGMNPDQTFRIERAAHIIYEGFATVFQDIGGESSRTLIYRELWADMGCRQREIVGLSP